MLDADVVIAELALVPHPEGGWYKETWRAVATGDARVSGTAIYYLLKAGERSHWHRIDATEIWHFYAGSTLRLGVSDDTGSREVRLGPRLDDGELPQAIVPPGAWQSAQSAGAWSLVGCTVSPAFLFAGFELAPLGWEPSA